MTIKEQLIYIRKHFPKVFKVIVLDICPHGFQLGPGHTNCSMTECKCCWRKALEKEKK